MVHSDAVKCSTVIVAKRIECVQVGLVGSWLAYKVGVRLEKKLIKALKGDWDVSGMNRQRGGGGV